MVVGAATFGRRWPRNVSCKQQKYRPYDRPESASIALFEKFPRLAAMLDLMWACHEKMILLLHNQTRCRFQKFDDRVVYPNPSGVCVESLVEICAEVWDSTPFKMY